MMLFRKFPQPAASYATQRFRGICTLSPHAWSGHVAAPPDFSTPESNRFFNLANGFINEGNPIPAARMATQKKVGKKIKSAFVDTDAAAAAYARMVTSCIGCTFSPHDSTTLQTPNTPVERVGDDGSTNLQIMRQPDGRTIIRHRDTVSTGGQDISQWVKFVLGKGFNGSSLPEIVEMLASDKKISTSGPEDAIVTAYPEASYSSHTSH